jgi:hypothetical protein
MIIIALDGDQISDVTWFRDTSVFPYFGLPRAIPSTTGADGAPDGT